MEIFYFNVRVQKFVETIDEPLRPRVARVLDLLAEHGHMLGMPFSKALGGGLFELRIVGAVHIRLFYAFHNNIMWLLHGCIKKTSRIAKRELEYAQNELKKLAEV